MTLPSSSDMETVRHLLDSDNIFKEKMDVATTVAHKIGQEALAEIFAAQSSLQQLSEGVYPPEMEEIVKKRARKTFRRYAKFMGAIVSLAEPRLSGVYSPGESPIHSLPPEMLSFIFTLTTDIPFMTDEKRWTTRVLRLVCRHWKKVAEETPTLWRKIDPTGGFERTKRALEWSKSVALDVRLDGMMYMSAPFMICAEAILEELPRTHSLHISAYRREELLKFADLLSLHPAPILTEFLFLGHSSANAGIFHDDAFKGEVPRLRKLSLISTNIDASSPLLRAPLTTLDLQSCVVWENTDELLHTLSGLPMLEHLTLAFPHIDVSKVHDFRPKAVKLMNLKSLTLRHDIEVILFIFKHIDIPNVTTVSLGAEYYNIDPFMESNVLTKMDNVFGSYLTHVFGNSATPSDAFTSLTITTSPEEDGEGYNALFTDPAIRRDGLSEFSLGFDLGSEYVDEFKALFMRTLSWTPMSLCITRLIATEPLEFMDSEDLWIQILGCLHNLEEVHVSDSAPAFIQSIFKRGPEEARSMRRIVLKEVTLEDAQIDKVAVLLSDRHKLGYPPVALSSIACRMSEPALVKLRETAGINVVYVHPHRRS